ncbi:hypothetical protein V500_03820 [Pseudogymnoascus sp. VKM F-4518 (FW-2643)]|nr:hypothetical protein V500_03820 [Pseudogymnoascus sp. VKM F-4518 (FW-2643)]
MASKSFEEALAAAEKFAEGEDATKRGPWDELASWYWGLWDELGSGIVQDGQNGGGPQLNTMHNAGHSIYQNGDRSGSASTDSVSQSMTYGSAQEQLIMDIWPGIDEMEGLSKDNPFDLPPKSFRDELVILYFKHVHPLCPVFDEVEFHNAYYRRGDMAFLKSITLVEFQALIFAGAMHLNYEQICKTKYSSIIECHESLFESARKTYHASAKESPISLARAAILLSFWSPFSSEEQSNCYWVDQAFIHARVAILQELDYAHISVSSGRRKIIWWCCQLRDSMLAFALRRINRLHTEPLTQLIVTPEDFGVESAEPCFMSPISKTLSIDNFIRQCELSRVMARIMMFQGKLGYAKFNDRRRNVDVNEIMQVISFHSEVTALREDFEFSLDISRKMSMDRCDVPCQLSKIISDSVIAVLYFPYTHLNPYNYALPASKFIEGAVQEVMDSASRIARSAEDLLSQSDNNSIPLALGAYITFPIVLKLTLLGDTRKPSDSAIDLQEMRSLMRVLYILKSRFSGGQFVSNVIDAVIKRVVHGDDDNEPGRLLSLLHDAAGYIQEDVDRYHYSIPEQVIRWLSPSQRRVVIQTATMVYQADQNYTVPDVDVLSLLFDSKYCDAAEDTKIHLEAGNDANSVTKSQARDLTQRIAHGLRSKFNIGAAGPGKDVVVSISSGQPLLPVLFYGVVAAGGVYSAASSSFTTPELARQITQGGRVLLSHTNIVSAAFITGELGREYTAKRGSPFEYRTLAHLPAAHIAGVQGYFINPFYMGGPVYWMPKFDFQNFLAYNKRYRITFFFSVPPIYLLIAKSPAVTDQFESLEIAVSGAAPLGKELQLAASQKLGKGKTFISQTWGLSETTGSVTAMPWGRNDDTGSVSPVLPNMQLRLVDDDGKDVAPGQRGEVLVKGPVVTKGYHNSPKVTKEAFVDGWFLTGDVAEIRNDLVYIVDRKKELIKYKGLQVAPAELEAILLSHPIILDAAVIGVEQEGTEVPRGFVVVGKKISEEEIKSFVKSKVASYKQLRGGVVFVDAIPKNASGKILRRELRDASKKSTAKL